MNTRIVYGESMVELSKEFFLSCDGRPASFQGYTLIAPCVSVGNVPQLTIDLILNTLQLARVGWINDDRLLPVIGNDALDYTRPTGRLHTGAEVYASTELQLVLLQLRSPVSKGGSKDFIERLVLWCERVEFWRVIFLSSSYSHERQDGQITGSQFRFAHNHVAGDVGKYLVSEHNWKPLETTGTLTNGNTTEDSTRVMDSLYRPFLSGSGIARGVLRRSESSSVKLVVLNMFCSQGDNVPDAVAMATHLNDWLKLVSSERQGGRHGVWILPQSWGSVYGGPHPRTLY